VNILPILKLLYALPITAIIIFYFYTFSIEIGCLLLFRNLLRLRCAVYNTEDWFPHIVNPLNQPITYLAWWLGDYFTLISILLFSLVIMLLVSIPLLLSKKLLGWYLLFCSCMAINLMFLMATNMVGLLVFSLLSFSMLFGIRKYYL
jgi:hypothetical protein